MPPKRPNSAGSRSSRTTRNRRPSSASGSEDLNVEVDDKQNKAEEHVEANDPANPGDNLKEAEKPTDENRDEANQEENNRENGEAAEDSENNRENQEATAKPTKRHRNPEFMLDHRIENCKKEETNVIQCMTALNKSVTGKNLVKLKTAISDLGKLVTRVRDTKKEIYNHNQQNGTDAKPYVMKCHGKEIKLVMDMDGLTNRAQQLLDEKKQEHTGCLILKYAK